MEEHKEIEQQVVAQQEVDAQPEIVMSTQKNKKLPKRKSFLSHSELVQKAAKKQRELQKKRIHDENKRAVEEI